MDDPQAAQVRIMPATGADSAEADSAEAGAA